MHLAALYDHAHIIEILHEHGADVDHTNNHHMTPLHYASRSNDIESVQSLLGKGANIHHEDKFNATVRTFIDECTVVVVTSQQCVCFDRR